MISINFRPFFVPLTALLLGIALFTACGNSPDAQQGADSETPADSSGNLTVEQLTGMIAGDPQNSQLYYERSLAYYEYGDLASALKDLDKTLQLEPDFASAYHDRGICRFELGMMDSALADFNRAIVLDSSYYEAYFNRALIYDEKGKQKEALADLSQAIRINPQFGDAYYNRGVYLLNADPEQACKDFKKASELGIEEAAATFQQYCK